MFSPRPMCIFFVLYRRVMRFSKGITIIFAANLLLFVALCTGNLVILSVLASRWSVRPLVSRSVHHTFVRIIFFSTNATASSTNAVPFRHQQFSAVAIPMEPYTHRKKNLGKVDLLVILFDHCG